MVEKHRLILSDTLSFLSLLKLKNRLAELQTGDVIEVVLNNSETVGDLERIINRSEDSILEKIQEGDLFKFSIVKGVTNYN